MPSERCLLYLIILHSAIAPFQINLDRTNLTRTSENDVVFQHNCLHVAKLVESANDSRQIISYCMDEWASLWTIQSNNLHQKFTFAELSKQNISSRQLYLWSAPIDIVEQYQFYLNQLSTSKEISLAAEVFYNCTPPRFGPFCQYEFDDDYFDYSSLKDFVHDFYLHQSQQTTMTCYEHLQCHRGPAPACLDWSEICDGKVDCFDGSQDEEHCWQLEINECKDNEYRCLNGLCIPSEFFRDNPDAFDCLDRSDELMAWNDKLNNCEMTEPTFQCEDVICLMHSEFFRHQSPLTSSCAKHRELLLIQAMYFSKPDSISTKCWPALLCKIYLAEISIIFDKCDYCDAECEESIQKNCPDMYFMPAAPVLFGHVHFAYTKNTVGDEQPEYVCFNPQLCLELRSSQPSISFKNLTCHRPTDLLLPFSHLRYPFVTHYIIPTYELFLQCNAMIRNDSGLCHNSAMYQCANSSKCISKYRVRDDVMDCYGQDDERLMLAIFWDKTYHRNCSPELFPRHFQCVTTNECISPFLVQDGSCHCWRDQYNLCDDEPSISRSIGQQISFPTVCDGFIELFPVLINGRKETDETNCEQWSCNNTYTRCDGLWNCFNGADEVDCDPSPLINCPPHHHLCVSLNTTQLMCLPIEKANDGVVDCFGATDEPKRCRARNHASESENFYCINDDYAVCISSNLLCDPQSDCMCGDDHQVCDSTRYSTVDTGICDETYKSIRSDAEKFLCERLVSKRKEQIVYFSLEKDQNAMSQRMKYQLSPKVSRSLKRRSIQPRQPRCHRGLDLRVWIDNDNNLTNTTCLCPPSFYGDQCQYQNQRISLTMRIRTLSVDWRTPFAFIVALTDNDDKRTIHSYDQFTYLPVRDCRRKFDCYLVYSTRPKLSTKEYFVHIDIYEKISFAYRGSWLVPLTFPFLPVHRLAIQLNISHSSVIASVENCSKHRCVHGRCVGYFNDRYGNVSCLCDRGWSGRHCTISHTCTCSSDSLCIGISADNRSICVCPIDKFGPRCLVDNPVCRVSENLTCLHGGQCIPNDEHTMSETKFTCICPRGFPGRRCELQDTKIVVSFHQNISLPQSILVHFIEVVNDSEPENASTFKTIPISQDSVIIYWSQPFHIVFVEFFNRIYYLIAVQKTYNRSATIITKVNPSDRCENVSEIFDEATVKLHLLRRMKYYHVPCQRRSPELSCFYDNDYFCLCRSFGEQRVANCFRFDHQMKRDCSGQSGCENGAQCFQDSPNCAETSMCVCPICFYGARCQFTTNGFSISLDTLLGYHISPHISIRQQSFTVQTNIVLSVLITIIGLINGLFSLITFKSKKLREFGSGIYLLGSSVTTLLTMTIFAFKFWILLFTQLAIIDNPTFIRAQCFSLDFLLRVCLNMDQWLNAWVGVDRVIVTRKGIHFDKKKSRKMAKWTILVLVFLTISTAIHDPIYRRLIDDVDGDQKRLWCTVTYPPAIKIYNSVVNTLHLVVPFVINLVSAVIISTNAKQEVVTRKEETHRQFLFKQCQQHRQLFIAPLVLVLLACPRLIITFTSGCMKSTKESWLFLAAYFISLVPPMLTFVIFVLPSHLYKNEFRNSIQRYRKIIQRRLSILS